MTTQTTKQPDSLTTPEQFKAYFDNIPDNQWTVGLGEPCNRITCAYGHAESVRYGIENLVALFDRINALPSDVNDGKDKRFQQPTPKARIIAALDEIIATQTT